jgi:hypothetical protein
MHSSFPSASPEVNYSLLISLSSIDLPFYCCTTTISGFFILGWLKSGIGGGFLFFLFSFCQFFTISSISY